MSSTLRSTRLRISIDDALLAEAMQIYCATSVREVIEQSLQLLVRRKRQEPLRDARGFLKGIDTSIDRSDDRH